MQSRKALILAVLAAFSVQPVAHANFFKFVKDLGGLAKSTGLDQIKTGEKDEDGNKLDPFRNVGYGGITIGDLKKKDRTSQEDIDLFTKASGILIKQTTGRNESKNLSLLGSLLGALNRAGGKKAKDDLIGGGGSDDLLSGEPGAGGDESEDGGKSIGPGEIAKAVDAVLQGKDIVGALGAIIPSRVEDQAKDAGVGGEGGGAFGVNRTRQAAQLGQYVAVKAIDEGIEAQFSEEGQEATAELINVFEEISAQSAEIADQNQKAKASLDVSKGVSGQLAILATQNNSSFSEAVQNRLATTQGNGLAAKLLQLQQQRTWDEQIEQKTSIAATFSSGVGFAQLVEAPHRVNEEEDD